MNGLPIHLGVSCVRVFLACLVLTGCQTTGSKLNDGSPADAQSASLAGSLTPLSVSSGVGGHIIETRMASGSIRLPEFVPVRRYQDVSTFDGVSKRVIVEYAWDRRTGVAVEKVHDEGDSTISLTERPGTTISFTEMELELGIALTRKDPRLADLFVTGDMNYYAGFAYLEPDDPGCREGSHCVHVIVSEGDGQRHVAHAIVGLMTRRVIHPGLDPGRFPDPIPGKS